MTAPFDHERWEELAVAHALDALEPSEEAGFLVHLADCARCRTLVDDVAATAADLALTVESAAPSERLRSSLLAEVARTEQLPQPASRPVLPGEVVPLAARPAAKRRWSAPPAQWLVAAAAGVALILGIGAITQLNSSPSTEQNAVAAAFIACSKDPQCREIRLTSDNSKVVATVLVMGGRAEIVTDGLAVNPASSTTYVLWAQHTQGTAKSVGVFDVPTGGPSVHVLDALPWSMADTAAFMVTREAGNTAPASGSTPLAKGTVSS